MVNRHFHHWMVSCALAVVLWIRLPEIDAQDVVVLKLIRTIALPEVEGRIDHFSFDPGGQRLFVCALGNNTLEVIDARNGERVHSISGLSSPQGVAYIPRLDRILIANDKGGICEIYDGKSFQPVGQIDLKEEADNVRYDSVSGKIYVGFGDGGLAIIDAADSRKTGTIRLSAHPEGFEVSKHRIFVNVPKSRHVAVIDRDKNQVVTTWNTDLAFGNFPMSVDETSHRLFIGCRMPPKLLVLDTDSGAIIAKLDISGDADDIFYDRKRHRIYVICGAGKIDVLEESNGNSYKASSKIDTAEGTRTGLFAPEQDVLFVAVPHRGSQRAEIRAYHVE